MSIASTLRKAGPFISNGATTAYPFTFKVFQASDVLVVQTDATPTDTTLVLNTDYTVTVNANQDSQPGGTVNLTVAPPVGYLLTLGSNVQQFQSVTLTNNGGFYPTVINAALDYVTVLIQQLSEKLGRSLTLPFSTSSSVSSQLPPVAPGSLLGWKADGTGITNVGNSGLGAGTILPVNMAAGATGTALSADTQAAAAKAVPADADKLPLFDSASAWTLKSLTWANLKAALLAYLQTAFSTIVGSQMQVSADLSPFYEGTQSTLASGAAYTLNGNILIMKARTHNTKIDASGNFTGVGETGVATAEFWGEDDVIRVYTAPAVTAGTVPTFGTTPTYTLDMKTGVISGLAGFYDIGGGATGVPAPSAKIMVFVAVRAFTLPAGLTASRGFAATAATASTTFNISRNGATIGTMVFGAGSALATFTLAAPVTFGAGDYLTVVAPATPDATLADIGFTLVGAM